MELPPRCINLYDPAGWRRIRRHMSGLIPRCEWDAASSIPADKIYEDSLAELLPSYEILRTGLRDYIEREELSFLGIHCCRPLTFDGYYSEGFSPLSEGHARRLVAEYGNRRLNESEVNEIVRALDLGCRRDVIMFAVGFPEDVDDHSKHYLLIGPEFFCEILNDRQVSENLRSKFRDEFRRSVSEATPTVFIVAVPYGTMSDRGKDWVVDQLVVGHLWLKSVKPMRSKDWPREMSMECSGVVPPSAIIGHIHPVELVNHMYGRRVVRGHKTTCSYCK